MPKGQHTVVAAAIRQAFNQPDKKTAVETWRHVADQLRSRWPKLADLMDASEADVLAYMSFPAQHRTKLHSTNPLERLNKVLCPPPFIRLKLESGGQTGATAPTEQWAIGGALPCRGADRPLR